MPAQLGHIPASSKDFLPAAALGQTEAEEVFRALLPDASTRSRVYYKAASCHRILRSGLPWQRSRQQGKNAATRRGTWRQGS